MLKPLWTARWFILLGLLVFFLSLAATTPIHFIWRYIAPQLQGLPVQISQPYGTVWQGQASFTIPELAVLGPLKGKWQLSPWPLLLGKAQLRLQLEGQDLRLELPLTVSRQNIRIHQANGYLDLAAIEPLLKRQRSAAKGSVELQQLNATANNNLELQQLSGQLTYSGGNISLLIDGKPVSAELEPLLGPLSMQDSTALLDIQNFSGESLLSAYLQPDGWAGLRLKRRFIDAIGQTWPAKVEADSIVFEASHKLL